jgi:hypothetical protein
MGGTLAACFIKFSMVDVINSIKGTLKAFTFKMEPPESIIEEMLYTPKSQEKRG